MVCLDDESEDLLAALRISTVLGSRVPVMVRTYTKGGLSALLDRQSPTATNVHPFRLLEETCDLSKLEAGSLEVLARAVHEDAYILQEEQGDDDDVLDGGVADPEPVPITDTNETWDRLSETLKKSSRNHAEAIGASLSRASYAIAPLGSIAVPPLPISTDEVEILAAQEHLRWMIERQSEGWTLGERKDPEKKTHPDLVDWGELSEDVKAIDRRIVSRWPTVLARAGLQIIAVRPTGNA